LRTLNLEGIKVPGMIEKIIATLFADDTTIYLSSNDDFRELIKLLDQRCNASGAKFNIGKTVIIPIGSKQYRMEQYETRKLNPRQPERFPEGIPILRDGEPTRSLGAWVGNEVKQAAVWTKTINKVESALERWNKGHPTMEGRRLISLLTTGSMTQYMARVQGMPPDIENRLEKRTRKYLWEEKNTISVNKETLYAPKNEG
ncbi:hypothetical protein CYLTODRAFT_331800, partial [Cylindrobasidium torrendii FP15055 ss-10]